MKTGSIVRFLLSSVIALTLLAGCSKIEQEIYIPLDGERNTELIGKELKDPNNTLKEFSKADTKATLVPEWVDGDLICVYSIDEYDKVIFIDTCAVYSTGKVHGHYGQKNYARITAEVAKECKGYFGAYPYDILDYKVGDIISFPTDRNFGGTVSLDRVHADGTFGNACIMTSWCDWCDEGIDGNFYFRNRASLLQLNNVWLSDLPVRVEIENGLDITLTTAVSTTLYYPIMAQNGTASISVHYKDWYCRNLTPKSNFKIGHIYPFSLGSVRLTTICCDGPNKMKAGDEARLYCYGVLNNDWNDKVDLSRKVTWRISPANAGAIIIPTDDLPGIIFKKEAGVSVTLTATFEGYSSTFTIAKK